MEPVPVPAGFHVVAHRGASAYAPENTISAFRLAVNRGLAQVYQSDALVEIFKRAFGAKATPTPSLLVIYGLGSYPQ